MTGPAHRQDAQRKPDRGAAQPRLPRAAPFLAVHPGEVVQLDDLHLAAPVVPGLVERFADGEQADHEDHDVDAVEQLRDAERKAGVPR